MEIAEKTGQFVEKTNLGITKVLAEEIEQRVCDSIERLSNNPRAIEILPAHEYITNYHLQQCEKTTPNILKKLEKDYPSPLKINIKYYNINNK